MSREWIDIFQTYYKYTSLYAPNNYVNESKTCSTKLSSFKHVDFQHELKDELLLSDLHEEFTDEELEEQIDILVDFLNLYGHKIKLRFMIDRNLSSTVTRINEILSRTTSNLLYVSIVIKPYRYPVRKKFKFPLRMKLLYIDTTIFIKNIYSKLFIDADVEEYPCLIFDQPVDSMLPEKYIDYTKITSLITQSFINRENNLDCCVNLRNLCVDIHMFYSLRTCSNMKEFNEYDCFKAYTVFKKLECLMLQYVRSCDCDIRQIDHIPYYYLLTNRYDYMSEHNRNEIKFRNRRLYEIECKLTEEWIDSYSNHGARISTTLRHNRFPHILRLSKVLPKTIFYSILKLFLQHN